MIIRQSKKELAKGLMITEFPAVQIFRVAAKMITPDCAGPGFICKATPQLGQKTSKMV
jgi:hypothetical protein